QAALFAPPLASGAPMALPRLRQEIAAARRMFQHGHYTDLVARLPALLAGATATQTMQVDGERLVADIRLAELYTLATELLIKLGSAQLAWATADRAQQAAHASGDLLTQASARRTWGIVLRRAGGPDPAQRLIVDTAAALQRELHRGSAYLTGYGSLLATAG